MIGAVPREAILEHWTCRICRKDFLDGDLYSARTLPQLPAGIAGIERQDYWLDQKPVCEQCATSRGIPKDVEEA